MERKNNIFNKKQQKYPRRSNFNKPKPQPKEQEFNLEKDFPSMNKNIDSIITEIDLSTNKLNFKTLNFEDFENEKKIDKKTKNKWLILSKENLLQLRKKEKEINLYENKKQFDLKLNKMIENWENFRDIDKKLIGDRSIYINNNYEINKLIKEENKILKEIDEYNEDKKNNRIPSEEQQIEEFDYLL